VSERNKIEPQYVNWQWQPPEVINPDQQRMLGFRAELSANRRSVQEVVPKTSDGKQKVTAAGTAQRRSAAR